MQNGHNFNNLSNALRNLSLDIISNANSGHPGICLGMADVLTVLYRDFLNFNPKNPKWTARDFLIFSAGHGSALLYSCLYLSGYNLTLDDLKKFRKLHSKTPGHPEYGITDGVEITTGPLGQGIASAVGIAMAYKILSAKLKNTGEEDIYKDVKIYCIVGDGCLMEGISQEAISFCAKQNLDNLVIIFDNNSITIDGETKLSTIENHSERFKALGFKVLEIDGHNETEIYQAFKEVNANLDRKMYFISAKTQIGYKSLKAGSEKCHGTPFNKEELEYYKKITNWKNESFFIPEDVFTQWGNFYKKNIEKYNKTISIENKLLESKIISSQEDFLKNLFEVKNLLEDFKKNYFENKNKISTRKFSQKVLNFFLNSKNVITGSADLTESICFSFNENKIISPEKGYDGNFIHYGIREHAMTAIMNGLAVCNLLPIAGTFLCFSDYMRPAIRLSALMKLKVLYVLTHDNVFLGEDGPTHQAIEHFSSLNLIPNLFVFRPCNEIEVIECYQAIIDELTMSSKPCAIVLSRQDIDVFSSMNIKKEEDKKVNFCKKGGYEICFYENKKKIKNAQKIIIITNGAEVSLTINAIEFNLKSKINELENFDIKIVSMPCIDLFKQQDGEYKESILEFNNKNASRMVIFAGNGEIFRQFLNHNDFMIDIKTFGESAPLDEIMKHFKFNKENLAESILNKFLS